jgi:transposase
MRSSYDSLSMRVKEVLKKDPMSGHLFLFVNSSRTSLKALYYDGTGLVIVSKRLERGVFSRVNPLHRGNLILTQSEFNLYFEGADLEKRFIDSPRELRKKGLSASGRANSFLPKRAEKSLQTVRV